MRKNENSFKIAMLRACGSKPLMRYVAKDTDGSLIVRNERSYREWLNGRGGNDWIGWQQMNAYQYDEAVFSRLVKLYQDGLQNELDKEWKKALPL